MICLRHLVRHLDRSRFVPIVITGRNEPPYRGIASEAMWIHIPDRRIDVTRFQRFIQNNKRIRSLSALRMILVQIAARLDDFGNFLPQFLQMLWVTHSLRPDIIHVNNEPLCNRAAILAGKMLGVPVICHVRGQIHRSWILKWLYRKPDHLIPVSEWVSEGIGQLGVPDARRTVIYDGIALETLDLVADGRAFRCKHGIPEDAFAVGLVGLLIPWKGQHVFLDTVRRLTKEIPKLRMLLVGGTPEDCKPYEQELRERVRQQGMQTHVIFTGHVDDMPAAYNGLDVVVSASTAPEPLGTMVIECMAMARPLVAPNHGGAAEMTEHMRTGLLFTPGCPEELADAVHRLYKNAELRKKLGQLARAKALQTFDIESHVHRVQAVYDQILGAKNIDERQG